MIFGLTEEQLAQWGLTFGVGAFILYMLFIILQLARESKAGRFGTFVLFVVLVAVGGELRGRSSVVTIALVRRRGIHRGPAISQPVER